MRGLLSNVFFSRGIDFTQFLKRSRVQEEDRYEDYTKFGCYVWSTNRNLQGLKRVTCAHSV